MSLDKLFRNDVRYYIVGLGGAYAFFGTAALVIVAVQRIGLSMVEPGEVEGFLEVARVLHRVWLAHMPWLIALGVALMAFGLTLRGWHRVWRPAFVVLWALGNILVLSYIVHSIEYVRAVLDLLPDGLRFFRFVVYAAVPFGVATVIALVNAPQIVLWKWLPVWFERAARG